MWQGTLHLLRKDLDDEVLTASSRSQKGGRWTALQIPNPRIQQAAWPHNGMKFLVKTHKARRGKTWCSPQNLKYLGDGEMRASCF